MNDHYSGRKWIVFIQDEINSVYSDLEMNSAYSVKKWIVFIQEEMNTAYSRKKGIKIVFIQGRNE